MKPDEIMFFRLCALVLGHNRASVNDIYYLCQRLSQCRTRRDGI